MADLRKDPLADRREKMHKIFKRDEKDGEVFERLIDLERDLKETRQGLTNVTFKAGLMAGELMDKLGRLEARIESIERRIERETEDHDQAEDDIIKPGLSD